MKVIVSDVIHEPAVRPVIVNFENGKICDGLETELQCEMYRNKENNTILGAYTSKMFYVGETQSDSLQHNFLIIKKKNSDKVRLVNVDYISMKPDLEKRNGVLNTSLNTSKVTNAELNKQFGSKKTKRRTMQKERLQLDIENVKEQLEETVAAKPIDDYFLNTTQPIETDSTLKVPIHRDAKTVEEVYVLDDIIPSNVLDAIEKEVHTIIASDNLDQLGLTDFCKKNIISLKDDVKGNMRKCQIYLYINYLMKFLATPAKGLTKRYVLCKTSKDIDSHILGNFSIFTGMSRSRPMSMRDKSICYVLVLAVLASNYMLDLEDLSKDLKIGIKKLQEMSRTLALSNNGPKTVVLKLPLPAPIVNNLKRKR